MEESTTDRLEAVVEVEGTEGVGVLEAETREFVEGVDRTAEATGIWRVGVDVGICAAEEGGRADNDEAVGAVVGAVTAGYRGSVI